MAVASAASVCFRRRAAHVAVLLHHYVQLISKGKVCILVAAGAKLRRPFAQPQHLHVGGAGIQLLQQLGDACRFLLTDFRL
jgi:hypothetical protein